HLQLPSFPTRRSSDLNQYLETRKYEAGILTELSITTIQGDDTSKSIQKFDDNIAKLDLLKNQTMNLNFKIGEREFESDGYETVSDRKSTRLNSSHVKI